MRLASLGLAMWLLGRFGVLERNESLAGDLAEERAQGRSVVWLWRQTFAAIIDLVAGDLREHWALALRAIALGWILWRGWALAVSWLGALPMSGYRWKLYQALLLFTFLVCPAILGWMIARTHRAQRAATVLAYAASMAVYGAWDLTAHYAQMKICVQCVPGVWTTNLVLDIIFVAMTLLGGLFLTPSKRMARDPR